MKIWNAISKLGKHKTPVRPRPRVSCVSGSGKPEKSSKKAQLRELARDILTMNKQMRAQKLPYHLQLADRGYGPEVILVDAKTGRPLPNPGYQQLHDLADLPRDG